MENTLIHLCSLVEYPIFDLEAGFCVNIPSESGVSFKYWTGRSMCPQADMILICVKWYQWPHHV